MHFPCYTFFIKLLLLFHPTIQKPWCHCVCSFDRSFEKSTRKTASSKAAMDQVNSACEGGHFALVLEAILTVPCCSILLCCSRLFDFASWDFETWQSERMSERTDLGNCGERLLLFLYCYVTETNNNDSLITGDRNAVGRVTNEESLDKKVEYHGCQMIFVSSSFC